MLGRRLRRLGFAGVALVAALGVAEAVCRQLPWQIDVAGVYSVGFVGCWFREEGDTVTLCESPSARGEPPSFPKAKGEACRVLFLGGSSVRLPGHHGWPERATLGDLPVEVINAGVPGATSLSTSLRGQAAMAYDPDVIVVYEGHNDLAQWTFGSSDEVVRRDQRIARVVLFFQRSALVRTVGFALNLVGEPTRRENVEGLRVSRATVLPTQHEAVAAELLANFTALVEAAGEVPVLQVVPVSNSGKAPVATVMDPDPDRGRRVDEAVLRAFRFLDAGDAASALAGADLALGLDAEHAGAWWVRARALQAVGRGPEAVEAYGKARLYDAVPLRSSPPLDDAVRAVPADEIVDLPALLGADGGLVPDRYFTDMVHLSSEGHGAIAALIAPRIQARCARRR